MKIEIGQRLNKYNNPQKLSFGRALTPQELIEYKETLNDAKKKIGNDGRSILIVHDACLPQAADKNTGVGNLSDKKSLQFFEFMKNYLNIGEVEVLPLGEVTPYQNGRFFCAYNSSAFSLSPHQINLELLTTPQYSSLLTPEDIKDVVSANVRDNKESIVNFENVVNKDSSFDKVLQKAFFRFERGADVGNLRKAFAKYKSENRDWLEPKGLHLALAAEYNGKNWRQWSKEDRDLLIDKKGSTFDRINFLTAKYRNKMEFYYFKQFLADEHLAHARKSLNERGLKLIGDCLISFSDDERWAYQSAFNHDYSIGWGLPALDYETIDKDGGAAEALLKRKVQLFAKRYDSIRFDVSWAYVNPKLYPEASAKGVPYSKNTDFGSRILNRIENYVREVKGEDFDVRNLIHEFDADAASFQMVEDTPNGQRWRTPLMDRTKALGTTYMSPTWGQNQHYLYLNDNKPNFILGAGNHDPQPLRQIAYSMSDINGEIHKPAQVDYLSSLFKTDKTTLNNPIEFIKAKFAEIVTAKNNQFFYIDVFGEERRFDSQIKNTPENYGLKIPENFERHYFSAVESGHGFNPMDAIERVFRLRNLNESEPELYSRIIKFRDILLEKTQDVAKTIEKKVVEVVTEGTKTETKELAQSIKKSSFSPAGVALGIMLSGVGAVGYYLSEKKESKF